MHRPRPALSALEATAPVEEKERRVALAFIDAACLLGVDGRGEPTEVHFAEDMAVWLLAVDWATASSLVRERLQHLTTAGREAVRASIAGRASTAEREAAYPWPAPPSIATTTSRTGSACAGRSGGIASCRASVDRLSTAAAAAGRALSLLASPPRVAGTINDALEAWAQREGLLADPRAAAALRALDLETFQRLTFPRCADLGALLWAAKYTLWLYLFDDVVERSTSKGDLAAARAFVTPCLAVPADPRAPPALTLITRRLPDSAYELWSARAIGICRPKVGRAHIVLDAGDSQRGRTSRTERRSVCAPSPRAPLGVRVEIYRHRRVI
jgi:hypothetical protein